MNTNAIWVGSGYGKPRTWAIKADIAPNLQPGDKAVRMEFRFCNAWVRMSQEGCIEMLGGGWCECWDMILLVGSNKRPVRVIGPCDFSAADGTIYAEAWRGAAADRRLEQAGLS